MTNLGNGRVSLKIDNSVLMQKYSSSLFINLILNLYIVYELDNWMHNPNNYFTLKNCLFDTFKLTRNADKSKSTI